MRALLLYSAMAYGGAEIGLTVARRMAHAMGGDVAIIDSEVGKGTVVRIEMQARAGF